MIVYAPQEKWHGNVVSMLHRELDRQAPCGVRAERGMAVQVADQQMPTPDVSLVTESAFARDEPPNYYFVDDLLLAAEAESPDSRQCDREVKPALYAKARIPHYWRVERQGAAAVVYVHKLDPASNSYGLVGIFHDRLKVSVPFPIDIDLTDPGRRL